jgi:radical SAM protein with 4Fe4S-binding SPASM domain
VSISVLNKVRERNIPLYALIELTHRCNLRCCHCYLPSNESLDELSTDQFKEILDQMADAGTLFITFSGGEVFLRDDFFEIATYARKKNFAISILTNGTLIDEGVADRIRSLYPLSVEISIYGANSNLHDGITGVKGSFDKSINAIRLLKERDMRIKIKTPLMKQNFDRYKKIISLADKLKVRYEFDPAICPKLDGSHMPLEYRLGEHELLKIFSEPLLNPEIIEINEEKFHPRDQSEFLMCGAGKTTCVISPDGDIYPCIVLRIPLGNLREQTFSEIWLSSENRKIRGINFQDLRVCTHCDLLAYCNRCPGIALLEDGDIFGPAGFFCKMAEVRKSINEERLVRINQEGR